MFFTVVRSLIPVRIGKYGNGTLFIEEYTQCIIYNCDAECVVDFPWLDRPDIDLPSVLDRLDSSP